MITLVRNWKEDTGEQGFFIVYNSGRTYLRLGEKRLPGPAREFIARHAPVLFYNPYFQRWEKIYR